MFPLHIYKLPNVQVLSIYYTFRKRKTSLKMYNSLPVLAVRQAVDLNQPLIPPPPGVESNFANPPNRNTLGKAVDLTSLVLATIFFLLRVFTRFKLRSRINVVDGNMAFHDSRLYCLTLISLPT